MRPSRADSTSMRCARRRRTAADVSAAIVSARTDRAPTGVRSSWLMFETKSRRICSMRRRSDTSSTTATAPRTRPARWIGVAVTSRTRRGGPNSSTWRSGACPWRAASSASRTACSSSRSGPRPGSPTGELRSTISPSSSHTTTPSRTERRAPMARSWLTCRASSSRRSSSIPAASGSSAGSPAAPEPVSRARQITTRSPGGCGPVNAGGSSRGLNARGSSRTCTFGPVGDASLTWA